MNDIDNDGMTHDEAIAAVKYAKENLPNSMYAQVLKNSAEMSGLSETELALKAS